jgi:hypothetical protein
MAIRTRLRSHRANAGRIERRPAAGDGILHRPTHSAVGAGSLRVIGTPRDSEEGEAHIFDSGSHMTVSVACEPGNVPPAINSFGPNAIAPEPALGRPARTCPDVLTPSWRLCSRSPNHRDAARAAARVGALEQPRRLRPNRPGRRALQAAISVSSPHYSATVLKSVAGAGEMRRDRDPTGPRAELGEGDRRS